MTWPLAILDAVIDSGIDIDANPNSRFVFRTFETDDLIDVKLILVRSDD